MMITRYLIIACATISFTNNAMEKKFDLQDILSLANSNPTHQPFIETYFAHELPKDKALRDRRYIELQSAVHNEARKADLVEATKACLLKHLQLAYLKKELAYHREAANESAQDIDALVETLKTKQVIA